MEENKEMKQKARELNEEELGMVTGGAAIDQIDFKAFGLDEESLKEEAVKTVMNIPNSIFPNR